MLLDEHEPRPKRLRAYHLSHELVVAVFRHAHSFPREQRFLVQQQLQRAALSIPCNVVEGCARRTAREYRHFVNIALGSAREAAYLIDLSGELSYILAAAVYDRCDAVVACLQNLMKALERMPDMSWTQAGG